MSERILAFDPGTLDAGAAVLEDGRLTGAWWLRPAAPASAPCERCARKLELCPHASGPAQRRAMLQALLDFAGPLDGYGLVVVEGQYIPRGRGIDVAPLLDLAQTVGAVIAAAHLAGVPRVLCVVPMDWKGSTDKAVFQTRILASLQEDERELLPRAPRTERYLSDPLDAAGLALYAAQRLDRWYTSPASFAELVEPTPTRGRKRAQKIGAGRGLASPAAQGGLALGGGR